VELGPTWPTLLFSGSILKKQKQDASYSRQLPRNATNVRKYRLFWLPFQTAWEELPTVYARHENGGKRRKGDLARVRVLVERTHEEMEALGIASRVLLIESNADIDHLLSVLSQLKFLYCKSQPS
jgi:hypothetical protein